MMCDTNADLLYALLQVEPAKFSREAVRQTWSGNCKRTIAARTSTGTLDWAGDNI